MQVTRNRIIARGLACECPNCGARTLFKEGAYFSINERCSSCGLKFDRGDGFFLGPFVINYAVTVFVFIIPVILLYASRVLGVMATIVTCAVMAGGLPILFYRRSWSWWLMTYFYFLPQKLPANRDESREDEEE